MHPNEDALNAYVDGTSAAAEAADLERHLASCASCRQTVDDLREILRAASALDDREPPARAWSRIERAIALDGDRRPAAARREGAASGARMSRAAIVTWLAAAAADVLATTCWLRHVPAEPRQSAGAARPDWNGQQSAPATDDA